MKHKKLLLVFSILFVLSCSLTAISANDLNDTDVIANGAAEDKIISSIVDIENSITTEPNSGNINENTFTDLNKTIADGGNVNLTRDYAYNESTDGDLFSGGIVIDQDNVVIDGNGHYINGEMHNRVFHIKNANNVTLKNINFTNAGYLNVKADGGVLYIEESSNITILNCKFSDNRIHGESNGGVIYVKSTDQIRIIDSLFKDNYAGYGGAVQAGPSTMIEYCNFTGNYANVYGGAIHVRESEVENANAIVKNCNFLNNSAGSGGAIYNQKTVTVLNCNFTANNASSYGGAIFSRGYSKTTIDNSNFIENNAERGGALFSFSSEVLIEISHFMENNAKNGGAIYEVFGKILINNSDLSKNTAASYGGAIVVNGTYDYTEIALENSIFAQNTATEGTNDIALANDNSKVTSLINTSVVPKCIVEMEVSNVSDINYTQNVVIMASNIKRFGQQLNNGNVVFSINGDNISIPVENGAATFNRMLDAGSYNVIVTYVGAPNDANPTKTLEFNVLKLPAVLEVINVTNCTYGDSIQIVANVTSEGSAVNEGRILIIVNGKEYFANVINGTATIDAPKIDAGTYSVNLTYDGNYLADNATVKFEVSKCPATIEIVSIANCTYGSSILIKINVTSGSSAVNEGSVSAVVNGEVYSDKVINGTATIEIPDLSIGTYEANITFGGNYLADNVPAKFEVSISSAAITAKDIAYVINYGGKYSAVIKDINGMAVVGEKVTFALDGKSIGSAVTDKNGVASINLTPAILKAAKAGKKNLVIKLVSDNYNPVSKTVKVTINKEKTKILKAKKTYKFKKSKKAKNIKVTLKDSKNNAMKKVKVTIKLSGKKIKGKKTITAKTNKKGVVTFKLGKKLTKKTKVKYTITFKGNDYYNKVVKKGKIIVK